MKFYNRTLEIAELRRIRALSGTDHSRMTVVTGRRRIGKTSLIKTALDDGTIPMVYFFAGRKAEGSLVSDFMAEAKNRLNTYVPDTFPSVISLLRFLFEYGREHRFTLVIDEFQEFSTINPSLFSDMQNLWDTYKDTTHVNLILSGSVLSMMNRIFTDAHEPLFGRADNILQLRPFKVSVLKEILQDYNPEYSKEDLLALYSLTGGIPKYIDLLCSNGCTTSDKMLDYVTSPLSPFIDEGRTLLITEFGKDYGTYFSILQAMAEGKTTQGEITSALDGKPIGGHLEKLENVYGIIKKIRPVLSKPGTRNNVRFHIIDNFLQFWFRFIERNRSMIELDNFADLRTYTIANYPTYSGFMLERYFRQKLAEDGGFKEIGSWWEPKKGLDANEIDIVGISSNGKEAIAAEVKRQRRNYDHTKFMTKVERLKEIILRGYQVKSRVFTLDDM